MQFNNALLYDEYAVAQKEIANIFVEWLFNLGVFDKEDALNIVELGCGTGFFSEALSKKLLYNFTSDLNINLVDNSLNMLSACRLKLDNIKRENFNISYTHGNAEYYNIGLNNKSSIILSNMCMQWFDNINLYIKSNINLNKFIAFTIPTQNSFMNWRDIHKKLNISCALHQFIDIDNINKYPHIQHIELVNIPLKFKNIKQFMQHFKLIGAYNKEIKYSIVELRNLFNYHQQEFNTNYEIAMILCKSK